MSLFFIWYPLSRLFWSFLHPYHCRRWQETNGIPEEAINHSAEGVLVAQFTANFFVNEARKSTHKYASPTDEDKALIYNYKPVKTTGSFVQQYFFHF